MSWAGNLAKEEVDQTMVGRPANNAAVNNPNIVRFVRKIYENLKVMDHSDLPTGVRRRERVDGSGGYLDYEGKPYKYSCTFLTVFHGTRT